MQRYERMLLRFLTLALVGGVFMAACGDEPSPAPNEPSPTPNEPSPTPIIPINHYPPADAVNSNPNCGPSTGHIFFAERGDVIPDILRWTQDGTHIILDDPQGGRGFGGRDPTPRSTIYLVDAGGTRLRRIVDANPEYVSLHGTYADVSPDGTRVVYASCEYPTGEVDTTTYWYRYFGAGYHHVWDRERYNYEIVTRKIDGSDPRRLTKNIVMDHYPVWSPDGGRIAFARTAQGQGIPEGEPVGVVVAAADGSDQRTITNHWASSIAWSPDGEYLSFESGGAAYTIGVDGSNLTRLSDTVLEVPVWSPDGSLVAFARSSSERLSDIVISSPDGSDQRAIAGLRGILLWSSDGSNVRFSQPYLADGHRRLLTSGGSLNPSAAASLPETHRSDQAFVARQDFPSLGESSQAVDSATASGDQEVEHAVRDPAEQRIRTNLVGTSISWSADGSEIRFVGAPESMESNGDAPVHAGIFSVGVDGTGMRIISEIEWPALVSWSSDGSRVAVRRITQTYLSGRSEDLQTPEAVLYTMASDGSDRRVLVSEIPSKLVAEHSDWRDPTDDIAACSEGYVVLDPRDNPGLVQDCESLLRARRALAGDGFLNWGAKVRITEWDGVRFVSFSNAFPNESNGQSDRDIKSTPRVRGLYLHGMRGALPPELGDLTALEWLWFGVHGGSSGSMGSIPPELGNLTNLTHLIMYRAGLTGSIPPELGNLSNLRKLHLSENNLAGSIPPELGNLSSLEELDLSRNSRLTGRIPLEVWNLWSAGVLQDADVRGTSLRPPLGECEGRVFWRFLECRRPIE